MIPELRQRRLARYAIAIALTVLATALTIMLRDELDYTHTILLFAAVVGSAYIGGLGPGLVSGTLGIVLLDFFLFPPEFALKLTNANEFLTLLTFAGVTVLISSSADRLQQALRAAERSAGDAMRARAEAESANKSKTEFLAAMSHDLRTPLNAIAGYTQLLDIGVHGELNGEQRAMLTRLRHNQQHLQMLVEQVLNFAKIEAGRLAFHLTDVPLNATLSRVSDMLSPQMQAKKLHYEFHACDEPLSVRADSDRLDQIVINLLTNAVKYTSEGGCVTLACAATPDGAEIAVRDTGPGIPPDKLETVFEPFIQLDNGRANGSAGVGLGLAISRNLARAMGGDVSVSNNNGQGAEFIIRLPRELSLPAESGRSGVAGYASRPRASHP